MREKTLLVVIVLLLMLVIPSFAGMKEYLDNSVIIIENNSGYTNSDNYGVYFGGEYVIKTPTVNFQPFVVEAPSFKAGCGGIDITFGAFSYFNVEYLVAFLKAVSAQAPAFAFKTAIQTLCPQCSQLMDNLTALANSINGLNFNSCELAQKLGGSSGEWFGNTINKSLGTGTGGPDWLKTFNEKVNNIPDVVNDFTQSLTSSGCNPNNRSCYANFLKSSKKSLLEYMSEDISYISGETDLINILRTLVGDLLKVDSNGIKTVAIFPNAKGKEIERIIIGLSTGDGICNTAWSYDNAIRNDASKTIATVQTICDYVNSHLTSIINKVSSGNSLSQQELMFLSMFKIPVYKLINILSIQPGALESLQPSLTKYLTYELTYSILSSIFSRYNRMISKYVSASKDKNLPIDEELLIEVKRNMNEVLRVSRKYVVSYQEHFRKQLQDNFSIYRIQAMMMASLARHPIMDSRLYTKTLLGF